MLEAMPVSLVGPASPEATREQLRAERDFLLTLLSREEPFLRAPDGTRDEAVVA